MADEVTFDEQQQVLVDKLVGDARIKAREKAEAGFTSQLTKDKEAASQAALAAEAKWKELAGVHEARVKELEPLTGQVETYQKLIEGMLKDKVKALGEAAKKAVDALPGDLSALAKLNWLSENVALFEGAEGDGAGTPKRPKTKVKPSKIEAKKISKYPIKL